MKAIAQRIFANPNYTKLLEWSRLITITGSTQALVQALSLLGGILVIRQLPTQEYALYTLANTMLGTMTVLADGGIATGVMAQGGKVWQDPQKLGIVLVTGLDLRKKFAIGSLLLVTPFLIFLLHHHGASWLMSALLVIALIPAFVTALSGTLLQVAPKLQQDIAPLQKNQIIANIGRLTLLALTLFVFPWAFLAILAAGLPQIWANRELRKISATYADWSQRPDSATRQEILLFVKRILPGSIYYCLSSQITIWLVSIFGSTTAVAQVGALGRLGMMLGLFSGIFATLIVPRFARLSSNKKQLSSRFIYIQLGCLLISVMLLMLITLFPTQVLSVLGKNYSNMTAEVILMTASSCITMTAGVTYSLLSARGWILPPIINIPFNIVIQVALLCFMDLSNTKNALLFSVISTCFSYFIYLIYFFAKIKSLQITSAV